MKKTNGAEHMRLKNEILLALGQRDDVMCWNNPTGLFCTQWGQKVKVGIEGAADILCVMAPLGRVIGFEVKTGTGRQSPAQKRWQAALERRGGIYIVCRCVADAVNIVNFYKQNDDFSEK